MSENTPEAAVEAAARAHQALAAGLGHQQWDDLWPAARERRLEWMRAALEAAEPHTLALARKQQVAIEAARFVCAEREAELLNLKGPCRAPSCTLHHAHRGPCDTRALEATP